MGALDVVIDKDYVELINNLKKTIQTAQIKAHRSVNIELIKMYWSIGNDLLVRQKTASWGAKYIEQVSKDLCAEFPGAQGFSTTNLKYMRKFAQEYLENELSHQLGDLMLPWRHIVDLLTKIKDKNERSWYAKQASIEGWSRSIMNIMITQKIYDKQSKLNKITNFSKTLPSKQSDLMQEMFKDPYSFDFLNIHEDAKEKELEDALIINIRDFILRLGKGFAFVGNQYHINVGGDDFYIDCLFYNIPMKAYTVIELKCNKFKPEYAGQLNFYLTAIDRQLKSPDDNPTIGILLCETKNEIVAQYAVDGMSKPMGISQYELGEALTKLMKQQKL